MRRLGDELESHLKQRPQYQLVGEICTSLEKLNRMGGARLFWDGISAEPDVQLKRLQGLATRFEEEISAIENLRSVLQADLVNQQSSSRILKGHLAAVQKLADDQKNQYKVERKARELPFRATVMPWSRQGEDERLFRKILSIIIVFSMVFGGLIPLLKQPKEKYVEVAVPERIAQLIKKKQEEKPVEQKPVEKAADKKEEKAEKTASDETKPSATDIQKARKRAETKGVLAFKNNFADLMKDSSSSKMGAAARISGNASRSAGDAPQRSIIVSQATGGSGGINTSALSRQSEGGAGQRMVGEGVKFSHVESEASAGAGGGGARPLGKSGRPSRTDEEIQIVFDRYKSALYRIYNRELRNNPTLRGKMVLRIVIEPDGRVSACSVKSTDLASPALSADIVDRVLKFNFGPKDGVSAITILYPIDFLPAT